MIRFKDRKDAGKQLAVRLSDYAGAEDAIVLALPRGGVPVAFEVAQALRLPLDVFLVRKLGVPGHEELAMGAVASGGIRVLNEEVIRSLSISEKQIAAVAAQEEQELMRRQSAYRGDRPEPCIEGKKVILIDDGVATGASMRAAVAAVRKARPACLVVAVPTAAPETCEALGRNVEEIICLDTPQPFYSVGQWYDDFSQTTDREVLDLLRRAGAEPAQNP
jgi:predicted phosphoribosyltransferase